MIKWFKCFWYGHDWKLIGRHVRMMYSGGTEATYTHSEIIFSRKCKKCQKIKFGKTNGYYEHLDLD